MRSRPRATLAAALALGALLIWSASAQMPPATAAPAPAAGRGDARWVVVSAPGLSLPVAVRGTPWVGPAFTALVSRSAVGLMPSRAADEIVSELQTKGSKVVVLPAADTTEVARVAGAMATATAGGSVALVQTLPLTGPTALEGAAQLDRTVGALDLSPGVSVLVLVPPGPGEKAAATPVIVSEPRTRFAGLLSSATTRRGDVLSKADFSGLLSKAVLAQDGLGLTGDVPAGSPALARVLATHKTIAAVDASRWAVASVYIALYLLILCIAGVVVWRTRPNDRARRLAAAALTAPLVIPLAGYLGVLTVARPSDATGVLVPFLVWAVVLVAAVVACAWRWGSRWAASGALLTTALVVVADQLLGAPLLFANIFGYSLADGGRFYGLGNEGAALLLGAITTAIALVALPPSEQRSPFWRVSSACALALALCVCVAPWWGANLGVAVWGGILVIGAWAGIAFDRADPMAIGVAAAVVALVSVALVVFDYMLGLTHVGLTLRALVAAPATIFTVIGSRNATDVATLAGNGWTIVLVVLLGTLVWLRVRPRIDVWRSFADRPAVRALATSAIFATLVALVIEDTGGSVGAYLVPLALTAILLGVLEPDERGRRLPRRRVPR